MASPQEATQLSLRAIQDVVSVIERKKRNLEKRKHRLEEYRLKDSLKDEQKAALSKYDEVVASIEVLDELSKLVSIQEKSAVAQIQQALDLERHNKLERESRLLADGIKRYMCLTNFCHSLNKHPSDTPISKHTSLSNFEIAELKSFCETQMHKKKHDHWQNVARKLIALHDGESDSSVRQSLDRLAASPLSHLLLQPNALSLSETRLSEPERTPSERLGEALQPLPSGPFNFIHSSCVGEPPVKSQEERAKPKHPSGSRRNRSDKSVPTNGRAHSSKQSNGEGKSRVKGTATSVASAESSASSGAVMAPPAPVSTTAASTKTLPTPLMDLTPVATLCLQNSKVLADAGSVDLTGLAKTKTPPPASSLPAPAANVAVPVDDPAILSLQERQRHQQHHHHHQQQQQQQPQHLQPQLSDLRPPAAPAETEAGQWNEAVMSAATIEKNNSDLMELLAKIAAIDQHTSDQQLHQTQPYHVRTAPSVKGAPPQPFLQANGTTVGSHGAIGSHASMHAADLLGAAFSTHYPVHHEPQQQQQQQQQQQLPHHQSTGIYASLRPHMVEQKGAGGGSCGGVGGAVGDGSLAETMRLLRELKMMESGEGTEKARPLGGGRLSREIHPMGFSNA